jgi:flagellar motor switch/type III secretory pathway protein FliN
MPSQVWLEKHRIRFCFNPPLQIERKPMTNAYTDENFRTMDLPDTFTHADESPTQLSDTDAAQDDSVVAVNHHWRLDCVLQGPTLELSELLSIHTGNVLQLEQRVDSVEVELRLNSQAIARGQLIDIEGRLGIRILKSYLQASKAGSD